MATYKKKHNRESGEVAAILELLALLGWVVWRTNTGAMLREYTTKAGETKRRMVRFGTPGMPDICGYIPFSKIFMMQRSYQKGRSVFIEVKRAGGRVRPEQKAFIDKAHHAGCFAVIGSFVEVESKLKKEGLYKI